ncbi:MAG TPA: MerR family DNA-binding transcriptional regulator [Marmoricola sp.]|nr:MerR family DNA-binding transcriptional regulator [Marmoricola sp.]
MRIGEAAEAAGIATQTIRFYERRGVLPQPPRGPNGYRDYDASVLAQLAFIRSGQSAGLTLVELASILGQRREGAVPCAHVRSLLMTKMKDIRIRQEELAALERELEGLISRSHRLDPADCTDSKICHIIAPDA